MLKRIKVLLDERDPNCRTECQNLRSQFGNGVDKCVRNDDGFHVQTYNDVTSVAMIEMLLAAINIPAVASISFHRED